MMDNYGTPSLALTTGEGATVTDDTGRTYLDLLGGIAVNVLGHRHPAVTAAVTAQLDTLGHVSNLYASNPPSPWPRSSSASSAFLRACSSATPGPRPTRQRSS